MHDLVWDRAHTVSPAGERVWSVFWRLQRTRPGELVTYTDVRAYGGLSEWEEAAVVELSLELRNALQEKADWKPPLTMDVLDRILPSD